MSTKTSVKSLFKAIRHSDLAHVSELISSDPALVNAPAVAPPKKDDGQSPLQVALKTGNVRIANWLLDNGADVNFMEPAGANNWGAPVLHDAIRAAIFTSASEDFGPTMAVLERMLSAGANPNATDAYGNSCLGRAILDARTMKDGRAWSEPKETNIWNVFSALLASGADPARGDDRRASAFDDTKGDPVARFLSRTYRGDA